MLPTHSHPVVPGSTRLAYGVGITSLALMGLGVGFVLSQCYKENPYIKRRQIIFLPRWMERKMGNLLAKTYRSAFEYKKNPIDEPVEDYLRNIVAHVISPFKEYKPGDWNVHIIHDKSVNACAIAGGNIFVNTGFLKFCKNSDEIAFMLAHEISHVEGRHSAESLSFILPLVGAAYGLTFYFNFGIDLDWLVNLGFKYLIELPKSRAHEYEADKMATFLCKKSGFDPEKGAAFFNRFQHKDKEFLATHPLDQHRIEKVMQENKNIIGIIDQNSIETAKELCERFSVVKNVRIS